MEKPKPSDFVIYKCHDNLRLTRVDCSGDLHTHLKNKKCADRIIKMVCTERIPEGARLQDLVSVVRLSTNKQFIEYVQLLIELQIRKGKKLSYYNVKRKKE